MIQLFDYIKLLFTPDEKKWATVNSQDKARNFFMQNRFLSIKYPVQVAVLSAMKVDATAVADYWHSLLSKNHGRVPGWIYTKAIKKAAMDKKKGLPSPAMIKWYCQKFEMGRKVFDEHVEFFEEEFLDEVRDLEKVLRSQKMLKD